MIKMADLNQEFGLVDKLVLTTFLWQCKLENSVMEWQRKWTW